MFGVNLMLHCINSATLDDRMLTIYSKIESDSYNKNARNEEEEDIYSFVKFLEIKDIDFYDQFYVNYTIPQISKEFDLLRISEEYVIDIEIKHQSDKEKALRQLDMNQYYLRLISAKVLLYHYCVEKNKLFKYVDGDLIEVDKEDVIDALSKQINLFDGDINFLFEPSKYLISPYYNTEEFIQDKYFLNTNQVKLQKDIEEETRNILMIKGTSGSGKSLVLYDFAKNLMKQGKSVSILHCNDLKEGQNVLNTQYNWKIVNKVTDLEFTMDYLFIDEGERLKKEDIKYILTKQKQLHFKLYFFYSPEKLYSFEEYYTDTIELLERTRSVCQLELKGRVRIGSDVSNFVSDLFNISKKSGIHFSKVHVVNVEDDSEYMQYLENKGITPVIFDESYYYNEEDQLCGKDLKAKYDFMKQQEELYVVILHNPSLYQEVINILIHYNVQSSEHKKAMRKFYKYRKKKLVVK